MTAIQLDEKEIAIFQSLMMQREKALLDELELLKSLQSKLLISDVKVKHPASEEIQVKAVSKPLVKQNEDSVTSWVDAIKNELKHFSHPVPSGEIVKRLLLKPAFSEKGKRFITKAVTSKLCLLQERGEVIKSRENGKFVYGLALT